VKRVAFVEAVVLSGEHVELSPLTAEDHDGLIAAASDGELWTLSYTRVPRPDEMRETIASYLVARDEATMMPFTVRRAGTGEIVGVSTFCNVDAANRRVEIGYTWYARSAQQTGINTESKLLMLGHAFDRLDCIAVEFRTHWLNHQSRRAIERLGAKQDGVLRSHSVMGDGTLRDTVVFSIIQCEWPAVRKELQRRLAARSASR
jgi:RimJ/RimL family protein N-acetyltransferase